MVHIFQKSILDLLRQSPMLRYSELQPDDIESSHFKYHLNLLMKDGLVEQQSRGVYKLTAKGKTAVDRLSGGRINPYLTPKVITYTLLKDFENYYLHRKDKEPYLGLINMIGGKVHIGEATKNAAKREVLEKTQLSIPTPTVCGTAEIRISQGGVLLSHVIAYIYVSGLVDDTNLPQNLLRIPIMSLSSEQDVAPDLIAIVRAVETSKSLFALDLEIDWHP